MNRHARWLLALATCTTPLMLSAASALPASPSPSVSPSNTAATTPRAAVVASVAWAAGPTPGMDVLAQGGDGALSMQGWDGNRWTGWSGLTDVLPSPPPINGAPAVAAWGPGRMDVFVRGSNNALWHAFGAGSQWYGWESLGGALISAPAVASWGPGRLDVFAEGSDSTLQHLWWDGSRWGGWESLGGVLTSGPGAVSWSGGRLDVFVGGTDGASWHRFFDGGQWYGWDSLGGLLTSDPGVVSWGPNRLDLFVRGTDNGLWHKFWASTQWSTWESRGGVLAAAPTAASWGLNQLDVFVRGTDNALWHSRWGSHGWTSWASRGGILATAPAATSWMAMANIVQSVPYYQQQYQLSCEEAALQMAIAHQGITITQTQALNDIGIDWRQGYYSNGVLRWGNPYVNFVGDPNGSEVLLTGYGTYHATINRIAVNYGANVLASGEGIPAQTIYNAVLQNHPVVTWVSFDWAYHGPDAWLSFDGNWIQYHGPIEHAVTIIGVNQDSVYVYNPWSGQQWVSKSTFEAAYVTFNSMAVVLQ
jgi:uncharacterized protein YvpB